MRIIEVQPPLACGTSQIPEIGFAMETISATETIISVVTGKNTSSGNIRGIGIAIGTGIATIGGTVTDAASLMGRG